MSGRKLLNVFLMLLSIMTGLAAEIVEVDGRGFRITAQKGTIQEIMIMPIASASHEDDMGMPFYLTDDSVSYDAASGAVAGKRRIARWSLYCNFPHPQLIIEAPHLMHADGTEVPYQLAFYYQFPYEDSMVDGNLIVESGVPYDSAMDPSCRWNELGVPVNFTERYIRFMLGDVDIGSDAFPYGDYRASVTVILRTGE